MVNTTMNTEEVELRELATKRVRARRDFKTHLLTYLLVNAFLVEVVFSWPGLSAYGAAAVLAKDFNAVVGVTLVVGCSFVLANVLVDLLYGYVDPRVRYR